MPENYFEWKMRETLKKIEELKVHPKPKFRPLYELPQLPIPEGFKKHRREPNFTIKSEKGHYVVYKDGKFYCSADTKAEAMNDISEWRA